MLTDIYCIALFIVAGSECSYRLIEQGNTRREMVKVMQLWTMYEWSSSAIVRQKKSGSVCAG